MFITIIFLCGQQTRTNQNQNTGDQRVSQTDHVVAFSSCITTTDRSRVISAPVKYKRNICAITITETNWPITVLILENIGRIYRIQEFSSGDQQNVKNLR